MKTPARISGPFPSAFTLIELFAVKRKPFLNAFWLPATVLLAALAITACSDREAPLPGGYFIFIASSSEMFLNEPKYGGSIPELGTDLEEIGNHNEFIFGRSGAGRGATPGYFLLNTKSGSLQTGLTHSNWLDLTTAAGIPNPPKLVNPARKNPRKR
jgi:hypothetical protein